MDEKFLVLFDFDIKLLYGRHPNEAFFCFWLDFCKNHIYNGLKEITEVFL